ncbi:MAG: hypothetical protein MR384_09555 [Lachnospiraceae bacterium]|nr:hypothetical protein [Lachnospiraceae bacterium]
MKMVLEDKIDILYTKGHSVRVAKYSRMIAEKMGLSVENCEDIYYMMHE